MKKKLKNYFCILLTLSVIVSNLSTLHTNAQELSQTEIESITLDSGDIIVIELETLSSNIQAFATTKTTSGFKSVKCTTSSGTVLWSFKLSATFSYTGTSARCTSVNTSYTINSSAWKLSNISSSKSGNRATGSVTAKEYFVGIAISSAAHSLSLSCSNSGNLS